MHKMTDQVKRPEDIYEVAVTGFNSIIFRDVYFMNRPITMPMPSSEKLLLTFSYKNEMLLTLKSY